MRLTQVQPWQFSPGDAYAASVTDWNPNPARRLQGQNPFAPNDPHFYSFSPPKGVTGKTQAIATMSKRRSAKWSKPLSRSVSTSRSNYPHPPFTAPKDFHNLYNPAKLPALRPPSLGNKPNFHEAIRRTRRLNELNDADFRKIQSVYLAMISYSDWVFGEPLAAVEKSGHADDTAIFVFSDHGEGGGRRLRACREMAERYGRRSYASPVEQFHHLRRHLPWPHTRHGRRWCWNWPAWKPSIRTLRDRWCLTLEANAATGPGPHSVKEATAETNPKSLNRWLNSATLPRSTTHAS